MTLPRPSSMAPKSRPKRVGKAPQVGQPKVFGCALEDYIEVCKPLCYMNLYRSYVYPLISYLLLHYDLHISWRGGAKIQCTLSRCLHSHNGLFLHPKPCAKCNILSDNQQVFAVKIEKNCQIANLKVLCLLWDYFNLMSHISSYLQITKEAIPLVMESCIRAINLFGLHHEGLFRVSGLHAEINELKSAFDKGKILARSKIIGSSC